MTVTHVWSGAVTDTTATVVCKTTGDSVRLGVSTSADFSSPSWTDPQAPTLDITRFGLTGLTADTQYWYRCEVDSVVDSSGGQFRTVKVGEPYSFKFAAASCSGLSPETPGSTLNVSNSPIYDEIVDRGPIFFAHLGDMHYRDIMVNDVATYRTAYDDTLAEARPNAMWRAMPATYMWDDHDFAANNSGSDATGKPASQTVYRERVPHYPLASTTGAIWQTFVVGRVRFIMTDVRSDSSPRNTTDSPTKVCLGAEQEQWFYDTLTAATEPVICWLNSSPWLSPLPGYDTDHWSHFSYERRRLTEFLVRTGINRRLFMVSGDNHALSIAVPSDNPFGRFPVAHFGALDAPALTKGGPFTATRAARRQYGIIEVTDDGGAISVRLAGYQDDLEWPESREYTFPLPVTRDLHAAGVFTTDGNTGTVVYTT